MMRKRSVIKKVVLAGMLFYCIILTVCFVRKIYFSPQTSYDEPSENTTNEGSEEEILAEGSVIDLGGYRIAYRIPNDKNICGLYGTEGSFSGDHYIAIRVIDTSDHYHTRDDIYYLPDIYENILEMKYEEADLLYIKYKTTGSDKAEEARVPLLFEDKSEEGFISISPDAHGVKGILPGQDGLQGGEALLPQTIWTECFECEGQSYEITFERVSPIYSIFTETGGRYADYCLRVKDGQGNAISEQMIVYFPVTYEEVYWLVDFSGNGFMDIAICVDANFSKYGWTELTTLIWNSEKNLYEKKKFPACREVSESGRMMQLWNRESSSVISFVGSSEIGDVIMERYLFSEGAWKCIGRLEPFYAEDSMGELQRQGYLELSFSTEGEQVEKNVIEEGTEAVWLNKESLWSEYNMNNLRLYPYAFGWEEIETNIGEVDISKYVRVEDK